MIDELLHLCAEGCVRPWEVSETLMAVQTASIGSSFVSDYPNFLSLLDFSTHTGRFRFRSCADTPHALHLNKPQVDSLFCFIPQ